MKRPIFSAPSAADVSDIEAEIFASESSCCLTLKLSSAARESTGEFEIYASPALKAKFAAIAAFINVVFHHDEME